VVLLLVGGLCLPCSVPAEFGGEYAVCGAINPLGARARSRVGG
jgi:hypothetical protein